MAPISYAPLTSLDNVPIEGEQFSPEFKSWITKQIDSLNYNIELLNQTILSINARLIAGGL